MMRVATQSRRRKPAFQLLEDFVRTGSPSSVDRDAGLIRGVKLLGLVSDNGRRYLPEAVRKAAKLYEGAKVFANHPRKSGEQRDVADVLGRITNVRYKDDGLYGDLSILKSHPLAERLFEAAERMQFAFGLSHNVRGNPEKRGNETVVTEIARVDSVDLVADPATTKGLYEGRNVKKQKKLTEAEGDELDMGMDDMAAPPPAPMDTGPGDWKQSLVDAIAALVQEEDEEAHKMALKIMAMLKPESAKADSGGESESSVEEEDDDSDDEEEDEMDKKESRREKPSSDPAVKQLCEELAIRDQIEDAGLRFAKPEARKTFIKSLVPLTESERKALIEERKGQQPARNGVRSQGQQTFHEQKGDKVPEEPAALGRWLNGR